MRRTPRTAAAALALAALAAPICAPAQPAPATYVPPKLIRPGTSTTPIGGPGKVTVKVLVYANGSFKVQEIIRSTNHADDAAALEIAKSGTYRPATKGGKTETAFYDYQLSFTGTRATLDSGNVPSSGNAALDQDERMLRAGNFSGAQAALKTFIAAHPSDQRAEVDLGIAYAYGNDATDAVAALDKGGAVPENYHAAAGKAYADYAIAEIHDGHADLALPAAKKSVALMASYGTFNTLGYAEYSLGDFSAAAADLDKARGLAAAAKADVKTRAQIDINLVAADVGGGNADAAKTVAAEAAQLDPAQGAQAQASIANYYVKQAQDKEAKGGSAADAAGSLEQAAQSFPAQAAMLYSQAAIVYLKAKPAPDNAKAKADADKALAIDPNDAVGNYAAGVALANQGKSKDALVYLNKADAAAKSSGDTGLATSIEAAIKTLNGTK